MKQKFLLTVLFVFLTVGLLLAFTTEPVQAAPLNRFAVQEPSQAFSLDDAMNSLKNSVGLALLLTAVQNIGKQFGWFKDGSAQKVSLVFNTLGLILFVSLQLSGRADLIPVIDAHAGLIANALVAVSLLVLQLFVSRKGHEEVLAGMPVVGKSFSNRHAGEGALIEVTKEEITVGEVSESQLEAIVKSRG